MAKTIEQLIFSVRANQIDNTNFRYKIGTTTSTGNAAGTTFIDSALSTYVDDFFNGCFARITSGSFDKMREALVTDFVSSSGTVTVAETLGGAIVNTLTYEIFEKGVWTEPQIIDWLNAELSTLAHLLDDKALSMLIKKSTITGSSGVISTLPTDMVRLLSIRVSDGSGTVHLFSPTQRDRFDDDDSNSSSHRIAIFSGSTIVDAGNIFSRIEYKPANTESFDLFYVPSLASLTTSQDLQAPDWVGDLLVLGATVRGFIASDDFNKAQTFKGYRDELVALANQQQLSKAS